MKGLLLQHAEDSRARRDPKRLLDYRRTEGLHYGDIVTVVGGRGKACVVSHIRPTDPLQYKITTLDGETSPTFMHEHQLQKVTLRSNRQTEAEAAADVDLCLQDPKQFWPLSGARSTPTTRLSSRWDENKKTSRISGQNWMKLPRSRSKTLTQKYGKRNYNWTKWWISAKVPCRSKSRSC